MLSIRLSRVGRRKQPLYRVVVMPKHRDPWAKTVEVLGNYNARATKTDQKTGELVIDAERVKYWISQGAEVSESVWNLLVNEKIVDGKKRAVSHLTKKRKEQIEKEKQPA